MKAHLATVGLLCLLVLTTGACVMRSTYNAAVADLDTTNAELDRTRTQFQALTEQVSELQHLKTKLARQIEAASSAVQEARQEMETEQTTLQERLNTLNQTFSQLTAQQNNLRFAIKRAKEERPALQSAVERYKSRIDDGDRLRGPQSLSPDVQSKGRDQTALVPSVPAPNDPVPNPALTTRATPADPVTVNSQTRPGNKQTTSQPVEEGWLSSLKGWVLSIWHSIFS